MQPKFTDNTLLRATVSKGFNTPNIVARFGDNSFTVANPNLKVEEVTSYQVGVETTALAPVWLKVSLFRHDVSKELENVPVDSNAIFSTWINSDKVRHQGVEADIRTAPMYHISLFGGATFVDSKNLATNLIQTDSPRYTYDVGLKYDNDKLFKTILQGHYVWWNQTGPQLPPYNGQIYAQYNAMIFDMSITKTVFRQKDNKCDVFFTAHNIFDGSQYDENFFPNPGRWYEGGVKYKF